MKPKLNSRWLRERCRVEPAKNLAAVVLDHLCLMALVVGAICFDSWRASQDLSWIWTAAVWLPVAIIVGALQHRIGLMGHEASHYLLHPNRKWNDTLAELLCFYPVFGTLARYRAKHLNHHLHPNDPERDPNLGGGKLERFYRHFPMAKSRFYLRHYLGFLWPPFVLTNLVDLIRVVTLGGGAAAEADRKRRRQRDGSVPRAIATKLGVVYVFPYLMLLREIFQHANAGTGELDNSRVIRVGPFARWAILGYGNDYHLIHHIYPNVPCYHLEEVHDHLVENCEDYRDAIVETEGLHRSRGGRVSLLDSLASGSREASA